MKFGKEVEEERKMNPHFVYVDYRALEAVVKRYKYEQEEAARDPGVVRDEVDNLKEEFFDSTTANADQVERQFRQYVEKYKRKLEELDAQWSGYQTFGDARQIDGYSELYINLIDLEKMRRTNKEALRKIVKKFDKSSGEANQENFMLDLSESKVFGHDDALKGLEDRLLASVAKVYGDTPAGREMFHSFRDDAVQRRADKKRREQRRLKLRAYAPLIAYAVGFSMLLLFLTVLVRPQFAADAAENWKGYVVIFGIIAGVALIAVHGKPADVSLMSVNIFFMAVGIINAEQAFAGFANAGVIANGILLPYARALSIAGGAEMLLIKCMGRPATEKAAQIRMCIVVATLSSVLNNTPIVFMMIPILQTWCSKLDMSVSKFMMPMSFAIMLGGTCSIVGSSANLVTIGMATTYTGNFPEGAAPTFTRPGFWAPAAVGLPVCVFGIFWMTVTSGWLLPRRMPSPGERFMQTQGGASGLQRQGSGLAGISIRRNDSSMRVLVSGDPSLTPMPPTTPAGGLPRQVSAPAQTPGVFSSVARFDVPFRLTGAYIGNKVEDSGITRIGPTLLHIVHEDNIQRNGAGFVQEPPLDGSPWDYIIKDGDVAVFHCSSQQTNQVRQCQGMELYNKHAPKVSGERRDKCLVEATVAAGSKLVGKSFTDMDFRRKYNACCLGISDESLKRNDAFTRAQAPAHAVAVPDFKRTKLQEGDTLLFEIVKSNALKAWPKYGWFSQIVVIENSTPPMRDMNNIIITLASLALLVILTSLELVDIVELGFIVVAVFIALKVITQKEAWASVKGDVLLTIAASFGIGQAMANSGVAAWIGRVITSLCGGNELLVMSLVYSFTVMLGLFLNNASVAVLVYPVAYSACVEQAGLSPNLIVYLIIMGAGLSFTTPMSYQTNQMVEKPGGYTFGDFVRFGGVLQVATGVCSVFVLHALAGMGLIPWHHDKFVAPVGHTGP